MSAFSEDIIKQIGREVLNMRKVIEATREGRAEQAQAARVLMSMSRVSRVWRRAIYPMLFAVTGLYLKTTQDAAMLLTKSRDLLPWVHQLSMRNKGQPDGIKIPEMFNIIQQCPKLFGISMTFVPSAAGQAAVYKLRKAQVTFPNVRMLGVSTYSQENSPLSLWARIISLFPEAQRLSLLTEQNLIDDKSSFEPASFYNLKELYLTNFVLKNAPAGSLLPKLLDPPSFAKIQRLGTSHPFYDLAALEIKGQLKQLQWLGCGQPLAQEGPKYRPADVNLSTFAGLRWLRQLDLAGLAIKFPFAQIIAQVPSTLSNLDFQGDAQDIVDSAEKVMNQQFSFAPLQRKSLRHFMIWTESNGNAELKKKCEDSYTTFLIGAMLENVTLAVMVMCM